MGGSQGAQMRSADISTFASTVRVGGSRVSSRCCPDCYSSARVSATYCDSQKA
ncbi:hypothetical protein M408DRAFT_329390, partial [Serendipita vermifera MAFF 305830]